MFHKLKLEGLDWRWLWLVIVLILRFGTGENQLSDVCILHTIIYCKSVHMDLVILCQNFLLWYLLRVYVNQKRANSRLGFFVEDFHFTHIHANKSSKLCYRLDILHRTSWDPTKAHLGAYLYQHGKGHGPPFTVFWPKEVIWNNFLVPLSGLCIPHFRTRSISISRSIAIWELFAKVDLWDLLCLEESSKLWFKIKWHLRQLISLIFISRVMLRKGDCNSVKKKKSSRVHLNEFLSNASHAKKTFLPASRITKCLCGIIEVVSLSGAASSDRYQITEKLHWNTFGSVFSIVYI